MSWNEIPITVAQTKPQTMYLKHLKKTPTAYELELCEVNVFGELLTISKASIS